MTLALEPVHQILASCFLRVCSSHFLFGPSYLLSGTYQKAPLALSHDLDIYPTSSHHSILVSSHRADPHHHLFPSICLLQQKQSSNRKTAKPQTLVHYRQIQSGCLNLLVSSSLPYQPTLQIVSTQREVAQCLQLLEGQGVRFGEWQFQVEQLHAKGLVKQSLYSELIRDQQHSRLGAKEDERHERSKVKAKGIH